MSETKQVVFGKDEKTRLLGVNGSDKYLCKHHADERLNKGESLGIPGSAFAIMSGMRAWPTGQESCDDCKTEQGIA